MDLVDLYYEHFGALAEEPQVQPLPSSGSHRRYYRLTTSQGSFIGVEGTDRAENNAFVHITGCFEANGIRVPHIIEQSADGLRYLQTDLGDRSLFDEVAPGRSSAEYSEREQRLLCRAISKLPCIQFEGPKGLDWSVCYPDRELNSRMIDFDLNYFKYCFLKTYGVEFDEVRLQDDFDAFKQDLLSSSGSTDTFMYRDFQARNIMLVGEEPYFIDYQGGRRGPIYYDVASFVYQARARYPEPLKVRLIDAYLEALQPYMRVSRDEFMERLSPFVLLRSLQTLGAYGFRGLVERKPHFLQSIPAAISNIRTLLPLKYPYLTEILGGLQTIPEEAPRTTQSVTLTIEVQSFSFREGYPEDHSGNGGGFVFDCRGVHNPGRYERYQGLTGRDRQVIDFLETDGEMPAYMQRAYAIVDPHIEKFLRRGFDHMQISFGCTGGQHRSVYGAEHMAAHIHSKYPTVRVILRHLARGWEETVLL